MNCKNIENKLIFYIEDKLSDSENLQIRQHLEKCSECSKKAEFIRLSLASIGCQESEKVNPFIATRILSKIETDKKLSVKKVLQPVFIAILVLFTILLGNFSANTYFKYKYKVADYQDITPLDKTEQFVANDISYDDYYFVNSQ